MNSKYKRTRPVMRLRHLGTCLAVLSCFFPIAGPPALAQEEEPKSGPPPIVLASVNGEEVSAEMMERNLSSLHSRGGFNQRDLIDDETLIWRVIYDVLIAQEARAMGLEEEPPIPEAVNRHRLQLATSKLETEEILDKSTVKPAEAQALFKEMYKRLSFSVVTAYDLEGAEALRSRLQSGEDMGELARNESVDPYRLRGGLVDDIEIIDLQSSISSVLRRLEPGELSEPIQTDLGWSIVRLQSISDPEAERFTEVKRTVEKLVRQRKVSARKAEFTADLERTHPIRINQGLVDSITPVSQDDSRILSSPVETPDAIVARIGDTQVLTAEEYSKELSRRWKGVRNLEAAAASAPLVLRGILREKTLAAESLSRGYDRDPAISREVRAFEANLLIDKYLEEVLQPTVQVSESDIREYYQEHRSEFHRPPVVRLSQVTTTTEKEASDVAQLLRSGTSVAWLAEGRSIDRFRDSGGDRGWYQPVPGLEDFNAQLFEAQVGEVLDPFGVPDNWVVIVVTDRKEQGVYELSEISGNVRERVFGEKYQSALNQLLDTLRDRSEVETYPDVLKSMRIESSVEDSSSGGH